MTDHDLSDLLDRLGERVSVGPPPSAAVLAAATRARRRRTTWLAVGSAVAVLAATIGGAVLLNNDSEHVLPQPAPGVPTPTQVATPPGTRLVGIGHLAIAVPEEWGTNALRCGEPMQDTVIIDQGVVCLARFGRQKGVESVHVYDGWYGGFGERSKAETAPFDIDGEAAERVATICPPEYTEFAVCHGAVYLPEADVTFLADSSSQDSRAKVDEILSWILVVPDKVAVPGFQQANIRWDHQYISTGEHYRTMLETLGLGVEVLIRQPRYGESLEEGRILDVSPHPGTMLAPGSVVHVTEVAPPDSP
jgi:hypothetical protein